MRNALLKLSLLLCLLLSPLPAPARAQEHSDNTEPKLLELSPADGSVVAAREVTVSGRVEDASPVTVSVNTFTDAGVFKAKADAAGRFAVEHVPVKQGRNEFTLHATDEHGNDTEVEIVLVGKDLTPPVAPVVFEVKPSTRLSFQAVEGRAEPESRVVITGGAKPAVADAAYGTGLFCAFVRLREGDNELTVFAADEAGASPSISLKVTRTNEQPARDGEPARISISSGNAQRGLPRSPFPRPLVALVTDRRGRPVGGVPVEFKVRYGDARFATGERFKARTDVSGRASARLDAGPSDGIQLVRADFDGNTSSPAAFDAETLEPRADGATSVSGLLLDWYDQPLADAPVHLGERVTRTGRDGRFIFERVAPGAGQRLEVNGEEIKAGAGRWSDAAYVIDVLPGANNELGRPLFASPLNEGPPLGAGSPFLFDAEGRVTSAGAVLNWRDEYYGRDGAPEVSVLRGVRFTAARPLDGLAFSATIVGDERVPVSLDDGLDTRLYLFVAPRGVEFDRPLPFKLPNLDHLAPGTPLSVFRYDALTGRWARDGDTARVGADGRAVMSEEGSGLRGGGWYAVARERTSSEYTRVNYIQVEGNPEYEGAAFVHLEVYSGAKTALMMSGWGEGEFKRLHFRVTRVAPDDDIVLDSDGMRPGDTSREVEITVTPYAHAMEPGRMVVLTGVGRPHPGGYYVWSSSDPSVASVEPFVNDGGSEHPNHARVFAHRPGRARVTALYVTSTGATSVATSEIICRAPKAP